MLDCDVYILWRFLEPLLCSNNIGRRQYFKVCCYSGTVSSVVTGGTVSKWGDMRGRM